MLVTLVAALLPGAGRPAGAVPVCDTQDPPPVCDPDIDPDADLHRPIGTLDLVESGTFSVWARGWALDPDTAAAIQIQVFVDGILATQVLADRPRSDVAAAHPATGPDHGFDVLLPHPPTNGSHRLCVRALDVGQGPGGAHPIGCATWTELHNPPIAPTIASATPSQTMRDGPWGAVSIRFYDQSDDEFAFTVRRRDLAGHLLLEAIVPSRAGVGNPIEVQGASVAEGGTYCYTVVAATFATASSATSPPYCTTMPPLPPLAPSGLAVVSTSPSSITLRWTDHSTDEAKFTVRYDWKDGRMTHYRQTVAPAYVGTGPTSTTVSGLQAGTTHCFQVRAAHATTSWPTGRVCGTTSAAPPTGPTGLTVSATGPSFLALSWTDNANDETAYVVSRRGGATSTIGADATSYVDGGLAPDTEYCYTVAATGAGGSSPAASACGRTSAAPAGVESVRIWHCVTDKRAGSVWVFDQTAGGWARKADAPSSWVGGGCGSALGNPSAAVNLPDGHVVTIALVIVDGAQCASEDPAYGACRRWEAPNVLGRAGGATVDVNSG